MAELTGLPALSVSRTLEVKARRRRHQLFEQLLSTVARPVQILDVGGSYEYWRRLDLAVLGDVRIALLNLAKGDEAPPTFTSVVGDARDLSRYADNAFDVVFSNSVLGQVGGAEDQLKMASEIRRVGVRYFVQTPNHNFPIDWRTLVPFFHFLPASVQAMCFRALPVGRYPRARDHATSVEWATRIRDIRRTDIDSLFPGATVVRETYLTLTKSFLIFDGFDINGGSVR
jgi:hypothetical protein